MKTTALVRLTLSAPTRSADDVPLVVQVFDDDLQLVTTTAVRVGSSGNLRVTTDGRVTVRVQTPLGHTLTSTLSLRGADTIDHEVDVSPLGRPHPLLRAALSTLFGPALPEAAEDDLWVRIWRRDSSANWLVDRGPVLTTIEGASLRLRSRLSRPVEPCMLQVGGPTTAWRVTAVPPDAPLEAVIRLQPDGALTGPTVAVIGADPGVDVFMAYLTLGQLAHADAVAATFDPQPDRATQLALAYRALLGGARPDRIPDGSRAEVDWTIVHACTLARDPAHAGNPYIRQRIRDLATDACRDCPPLWTVGLRLLADLVRDVARWPGGPGDELDDAWQRLRPMLALADLTAPTVTYPADEPASPDAVPSTGIPDEVTALPPLRRQPRQTSPARADQGLAASLNEVLTRLGGRLPGAHAATAAGIRADLLQMENDGLRLVLRRTVDDAGTAFAGYTVGLTVGHLTHLAVIGSNGAAVLPQPGASDWRLVAYPPESYATAQSSFRIPDPPPPSELAAMSPDDAEATELIAPDGVTRLQVLNQDPSRGLELALSGATDGPGVLPVEYTAIGGAHRTIWLPLLPAVARSNVRVHLGDRDPDLPMRASAPMLADRIDVWDAGTLRASTAAASNAATRLAWLRLLEFAPAGVGALIDGDLLGTANFPPSEPPRFAQQTADVLYALRRELPFEVAVGTPTEWIPVGDRLAIRVRYPAQASAELDLRAVGLTDAIVVLDSATMPEPRLAPIGDTGRATITLPPAPSIDVVDIIEPADIGHKYAPMIANSIVCADASGVGAWRRIGGSRLYGDPVRVAVACGLRRLT